MSEGPASTAPVTPARVFETLNAYQQTAVLRAAIDLDLFTAIGEGNATLDQLARRCGASTRGIRILADYLVVLGLLSKQDGHYAHSPVSEMFLDHRSPACIASTARFLLDPRMMAPFDRLTEIVRSGHTTLPGQGTVEENNPVWVEFAESMAPMMAGIAPSLASVALNGTAGPLRVLDIAAGHGLFGIEVAKQHPEAYVTALDWAAVLEVAQRNAGKAGVDSRYGVIPGNAFKADFAGPYDLALLTNFLHHFDHATNVTLLRKVRAALNPGGRAVTLEFIPNDDRVSPPMPATFALIMLSGTVGGDAFTYKELDAMHREAGFSRTQFEPLPNLPQSAVIAYTG